MHSSTAIAYSRRAAASFLSAVAAIPWTLLATDFSFVFASNPQAHWWSDLLRGNLLLSLAYANPIVPALGLVLGALLCLSRFEETGSRGHLALAALQALATRRVPRAYFPSAFSGELSCK